MSDLIANATVIGVKRANKEQLEDLAESRGIVLGEELSVREIRQILIEQILDNRSQEEVDAVEVRASGSNQSEGLIDSDDRRFTFDQVLTLRRLEIEREREKEELEARTRIELEKLRLEGERLRIEEGVARRESQGREPGFRLQDCYRSLPYFEESDVERFFIQFERIADELGWPREVWHILVQSKLTGKAARAYNCLPLEDARVYNKLKDCVLIAYSLTTEAYRQKFREIQKTQHETFCEFLTRKKLVFDKWIRAEEIGSDFDKLRQLCILEEFKNCIPDSIKLHIEDQQIKDGRLAAEAADRFSLIHREKSKNQLPSRQFINKDNSGNKPNFSQGTINRDAQYRAAPQGTRDHSVQYRTSSQAVESVRPFSKGRLSCTYCKMTNHTINDCFKRKRDMQKTVAFVQNSDQRIQTPVEEIQDQKYVYRGWARGSEKQEAVQLNLFRDTGAYQSLITSKALARLDRVVPTGKYRLIRTVGSSGQSIPLVEVMLDSEFGTGKTLLGVVDEIPLQGVDVLVGNDLTDKCCVKSNSDFLEVRNQPSSETEVEEESDCRVFPACVTTRAMAVRREAEDSEVDLGDTVVAKILGHSNEVQSEVKLDQGTDREVDSGENVGTDVKKVGKLKWDNESVQVAQRQDASLKVLWDKVSDSIGEAEKSCFCIVNGVLVRKSSDDRDKDGELDWRSQVVLPTEYRAEVLSLAHESLFAGHQGRTKTFDRVARDFFWVGMYKDVEEFCRTCTVCQLSGKPNQRIPQAPLHPISVPTEAFSRVVIDCVGPLERTSANNQYLLTIMCATTRFPEAIPLKKITARIVANALIKYFTMTGLPLEIQSDQGSNFMSKLMKQVTSILGIEQIHSSAYHPESQGCLERWHQSVKSMLRTCCFENPKDWDQIIPYVMFAAREAKNESLGFSPFELLYGHTPKGPLRLIKDRCLQENSSENLLDYVAKIKEKLYSATNLAREHLFKSQEKMKAHFDRNSKVREFKIGDKVLLYLPISKSTLQSKYSGPYVVKKKVSEVGYIINTPDRIKKTRFCHVNLLKAFSERPLQVTPVMFTESSEFEDMDSVVPEPHLKNSDVLRSLDDKLSNLPATQREDVKRLIREFEPIFGDAPTVTNAAELDIDIGDATPIKQHPYRMSPEKRDILRVEIDELLRNGIIEESSSEWSSPCILVPKANGSYRMCSDLRKVNQLIKADSYPMRRIDDCIDRVGNAKFITKLDLLKGYYQIPLTDRAKRVLTIITPDGLYSYRTVPFGLKTAGAVFQRMVNKLLRQWDDVDAYLDDVMVTSDEWSAHLRRLRDVFQKFLDANLTVNLAKCEFGSARVECLGHVVGLGKVLPSQAKIDSVLKYPQPTNRRGVRQILGATGFYRRFCPNYAIVAAPLTDLLKKDRKFVWTPECEKAFQLLKQLLCSSPVVAAPNFSRPFKLAVDASNLGAGAVLFQEDDNSLDHPVSYFSKKFDRHQLNYSTVEKEALGLVLALKHFHIYLKSPYHQVTVFTDNNPLTFVNRAKHLNQRILRWSLMLQEYQLVIKHIAGSDNILADALSRA